MLKYSSLLLLPIVFTGCALTVDEADIAYRANRNFATTVAGANKIKVNVEGEDKRTGDKTRVSCKKNGYGMEMAKIVAKRDVVMTFVSAVSDELANLGFKLGEGGKTLKVDVLRFYNDFKIGYWAGDATADGIVNVSVINAKGKSNFSRSYDGHAVERNVQLCSGKNAGISLSKVMSDIVEKIATDQDLHEALLKD